MVGQVRWYNLTDGLLQQQSWNEKRLWWRHFFSFLCSEFQRNAFTAIMHYCTFVNIWHVKPLPCMRALGTLKWFVTFFGLRNLWLLLKINDWQIHWHPSMWSQHSQLRQLKQGFAGLPCNQIWRYPRTPFDSPQAARIQLVTNVFLQLSRRSPNTFTELLWELRYLS